jgi:hypothetical protein
MSNVIADIMSDLIINRNGPNMESFDLISLERWYLCVKDTVIFTVINRISSLGTHHEYYIDEEKSLLHL